MVIIPGVWVGVGVGKSYLSKVLGNRQALLQAI